MCRTLWSSGSRIGNEIRACGFGIGVERTRSTRIHKRTAKNLTEHRYMCSEDVRKYRRIGSLQVDQTVTGDSMDLEYAHDASASCKRSLAALSVQCTRIIALQLVVDNILG